MLQPNPGTKAGAEAQEGAALPAGQRRCPGDQLIFVWFAVSRDEAPPAAGASASHPGADGQGGGVAAPSSGGRISQGLILRTDADAAQCVEIAAYL